jgi:hypothetical protein
MFLSKAFTGKSIAGMRLLVLLDCEDFLAVLAGGIRNEFPGFVL